MTLCSPYWFQVSSLGHSKVFSACTQNGDVDFLFTSHWLITNRNSFFIHYVLAFNFCSDHFTGDLVYPPSRKGLLHIFTVLYILCMWFEASFMDQVVQCSASSLGRTTVHSITTQPSTTMTEMTWETAVTTARTTTTQTRPTQITMGKETPAQLTLMGTVGRSLIPASP